MGSLRSARAPACHALLAVAFLFATSHPSLAASIVWSNSSGGNWSIAANWNSGAGPVPGPSDDAIITLSGTYTVSLDVDATVASVILGGASGTQTLSASGRTLTLNGASAVNANGVLAFNSGTIDGPGSLTNQGTLEVAFSVLNTALVNQGTVRWQGGGNALNGALTTAGTATHFLDSVDLQIVWSVLGFEARQIGQRGQIPED